MTSVYQCRGAPAVAGRINSRALDTYPSLGSPTGTSPLNILVDGVRATLVGMSSLPAEDRRVGDLRYRFPGVIEQRWTAFADLYALWASLLDGLQPGVLKQAGVTLSERYSKPLTLRLMMGSKPK